MPTTDVQAVSLPFQEASAFFRQKARVPTERWSDVWREAHSRSFMVAGAASDALLKDFQDAIQKALDHGTTLAEFRGDFDTIVKRHGWSHTGTPGWRSRIIYETNLASAYSAGRYVQMTEPDNLAAYPYWQYVHSGNPHPRLQHLAWDGLTLRADDDFWDTHYPPNGWHCGCRVRPVSEAGLGRMGKNRPDQAPPPQTRIWVDKVTGTHHEVPIGIDPGFDYNPGKAWVRAPVRSDPVRALPLPSDPRHPDAGAPLPAVPAALRAALEGSAPISRTTIGELPEAAAQALRVKSRKVLLDENFIAHQLGEDGSVGHADVLIDEYGALPELISNPTVILEQPNRRLLLLRRSGRVYVAAIKTTQDRQELWLLNFRRAHPKNVQRLLAQYRLVHGDPGDLADD